MHPDFCTVCFVAQGTTPFSALLPVPSPGLVHASALAHLLVSELMGDPRVRPKASLIRAVKIKMDEQVVYNHSGGVDELVSVQDMVVVTWWMLEVWKTVELPLQTSLMSSVVSSQGVSPGQIGVSEMKPFGCTQCRQLSKINLIMTPHTTLCSSSSNDTGLE